MGEIVMVAENSGVWICEGPLTSIMYVTPKKALHNHPQDILSLKRLYKAIRADLEKKWELVRHVLMAQGWGRSLLDNLAVKAVSQRLKGSNEKISLAVFIEYRGNGAKLEG